MRKTRDRGGNWHRSRRTEIISVSDDIVSDAHFVTAVFLSEEFRGEPEVREPEKIVEWHWFDPRHLPSPMYFPSERAIKNYLTKKIYNRLD